MADIDRSPPADAAHYRKVVASDHVTYSVPRAEIIEKLNRALQQNEQADSCDITNVAPTFRYHFPHKADVAIDPADMAYLAECHGHYQEAERLYYQSLDLRTQQYGDQHPEVATILSDLGGLYCLQSRYAEAEPLLKQALAIKQIIEADHIETGHVLYQLAKLYKHKEHYSEADPLFQKALSIFRQRLGSQHPRTQAVYSDLMDMVVTAIEIGKFAELSAGLSTMEIDQLSEKYLWAAPRRK